MENVIAISIIAVIVAGIVVYLVKAKRKGETCIGCHYAKQCKGKCGCNMPHEVNEKKE